MISFREKSVGKGAERPSELVVDDHGGVVGPSLVVGGRAVARDVLPPCREGGGGQLVVDAPARVVVERLAAPRPPRVRPIDLTGVPADDVDPAETGARVVVRVALRPEDAV